MLLKEFRLQFPYKVVLISKECIWLWLYSCYSHFSVAYIKQLKYALVTARFRAQYDQYFPSFSYFTDLFEEPLGKRNNSEIWETRKILRFTILLLWKYMVKFFFYLQLSVFSKTTQVHDSENIITSANINCIFLKSLFHSKWCLWCINK